MDFLAILGCETHFNERIAPKSIEIVMEKLRMKFLALNVDFDGLSLDFLNTRKLVHDGIKGWYLCKNLYFTVVDLERQNKGFYGFFWAILGCDTSLYHSQGGTTELSLCDPDR